MKQPEWRVFGPTFASEQLTKRHQIHVSKETTRGWMIEAGLWRSHPRKLKQVHAWRPRRSRCGELVQWDTSTHDWLEGRGEPVRHLVRLIDDATSRSWSRFVWHDGTRENMGVLWEYLERYGRMVDVYTDRDSMFTVASRPAESQADRLREGGPRRGMLWNEAILPCNFFILLCLAEREGFEPSIEFPLYTLSKRAPSTTRPSLRLVGFHQNSMRGARHRRLRIVQCEMRLNRGSDSSTG